MKLFFKKILPVLSLWVGLIILQLPVIWFYYPGPTDFEVNETITGKYHFDGRSARSRSTTDIGRRPVLCGVGVFGPETSCTQQLDGKEVTAKLAQAPSIFGSYTVLMEATTADGWDVRYTKEERVRYWRALSLLGAARWALIATAILVVSQRILRSKNQDKGKKS